MPAADTSCDLAGPPGAPAIVLVHGSVVSRKIWGPQLPALSASYRVIAPDLPGHGDLANVPFSFDAAIEVLRGVIDRHARGRAFVVGLSLGGYIAIEFAARHPERVEGLVIAGATVNFTGVLGWYLKAVSALMRRGWLTPKRATMERKTRALFPQALAADRDAQMAAGVFPGALAPAFTEMAGRDFAAILAKYPGPTLLLNGARDTRAAKGAAAFATRAPRAKVAVIENAGHASNLDQPERFTAAVAEFAGT